MFAKLLNLGKLKLSEKGNEHLECNKLLLNFYASELSTHGRLVIGFAALIFTISQVALGVSQSFSPLNAEQFWIIAIGMFTTSMTFCFTLMRMLVYGILAAYSQHIKVDNFEIMNDKIEIECGNKEKILGIIPISFYIGSKNRHPLFRRFLGIVLCAIPSVIVTISLLLVLRLTTLNEIISQIISIF